LNSSLLSCWFTSHSTGRLHTSIISCRSPSGLKTWSIHQSFLCQTAFSICLFSFILLRTPPCQITNGLILKSINNTVYHCCTTFRTVLVLRSFRAHILLILSAYDPYIWTQDTSDFMHTCHGDFNVVASWYCTTAKL